MCNTQDDKIIFRRTKMTLQFLSRVGLEPSAWCALRAFEQAVLRCMCSVCGCIVYIFSAVCVQLEVIKHGHEDNPVWEVSQQWVSLRLRDATHSLNFRTTTAIVSQRWTCQQLFLLDCWREDCQQSCVQGSSKRSVVARISFHQRARWE